MFLTHLKTVLVEAMKRTFDADFPEPDFRNLRVGIEFPFDQQDYPGIWVDFTPTSELAVAGIAHVEHAVGEGGVVRPYTRWRYGGMASYTMVALTSFERDRLFDEVVKVMAFGHEETPTSEFRAYIESNEFIGVNFDFDQVTVSGFAATPGTPWGTEDIIYEATIQMECLGEFVSDGATGTLIPLTAIITTPYDDRTPDPEPIGNWI
jgi:hypothetical protein